MKKIIPILMLILFSTTINAQSNYEDLWAKVHQFEIDNLPKSALKVVDEIYLKAKNNNNSPQVIKCLFYKSKFLLILEEDAQLKVVNQFKHHISKSNFPTKNVLENVLANLYWQYFQQNRWKFYNRTQTEHKVDKNDFRTWDLNTLFAEIHHYYNKSLQNKRQLQKVAVHDFATIIHVKKDSKKVRPTLYDFLAHNALEFYKTDENNITKPTYQFKIDDAKLLSDANSFSKVNLTTKDSLSLQFNALKIYQNLTAFHLKNKNLDALINVDLQRLDFVNKHATFKDKQALYLQALQSSKEAYKNHESSGLYAYQIAKIFNQQANSYTSESNQEHRFKNKEALAICEEIISKFPKSIGAKSCTSLKLQITSENLQILGENFVPIKQHSRLLITYKNVDKLFFTAYKVNRNQLEKLRKIYDDADKIKFINNLLPIKKWNANLRNEHDYLKHTTEVVVPKLSQNNYLIVASKSAKLSADKIYATANIQATNLVLIENSSNNTKIYQVVQRNTGKPIKGAKIHLKNYNINNRYNSPIDITLKTDNKGFASFKSKKTHDNVLATVATKNDQAIFGHYYLYNNDYKRNSNVNDEETIIKPFIFTDRSIYRPGQTVYFKTIFIQKKGEKTLPFTKEYIKIVLNDPNGQKKGELELKLNEFGATSGEFILPNNGLTGQYTFDFDESEKAPSKFYENADFNFDYYNEHTISVEEYKRPKFETAFKPITETFKINDSVTVNGFAKAFSGANITDAKVVYRVHRKVQYPNWWYWYRPYYNSEPQEIVNGESSTDSKGNFNITFKAMPDESVDAKNLPVFTYEISADVTDINGETRTAKTTVKVGYHALLANITMPTKINKKDKKQTITIDTKNLNGEFIPAKGTVKIYKLKSPTKPLRKRPWNAPDYQDIPENEFRKMFPNEAYTKEESDEKNWKKGALVFTSSFDTSNTKEIQLKNIKNWISGKYIAILETKDKFNQEVTAEARFSINSLKEKNVADNKLFYINLDKEAYKVGEKVQLQVGSASKDITVVVMIEKDNEIISTKLIHLNNEIETLKIPIKKQDIGGFAVKYYYVNYNEFNSGHLIINVPEEQFNIQIETNTFRDKLQPNGEQNWSFTIKNDKDNKITSEVLASMYDASLDQFKTHNWQFNPIQYKSYYSYGNNASAYHSFGKESFRVFNSKRFYAYQNNQQYDKLNWFGFDFNNNRWKQHQYINSLKRTRKDFDGILSGTIKDETGGIPDVTITIKGTHFGTETDFDGKYSIKVKKGDTIIISYIGYETYEFTVGNIYEKHIKLKENNAVLDEVVVTSYGVSKMKAGRMMAKSESASMMSDSDGAPPAPSGNNKNAKHYNKPLSKKEEEQKIDLKGIKIRKNLQETAFFYPHLTTDKNGNISFNFKVPEALTRWKLQLLAHTKNLQTATKTLQTITQKELMVTPNAPRFLRHGDTITLRAKISNLSDKNLQGLAQLIVTDAITGKEISLFNNSTKSQPFSVDTNGNTNVSWHLAIPNSIDAIQYKVVAKAGDFSDGEQNALPVLSNRTLVTETLPMWVRSNQTKTFSLNKLKTNNSKTLKHHKLTLEVTSNPAWYAVQALPYLMEYPYQCSEQTFARFYANTLASHIANSNPRIQEVFNLWKSSDALLSNLEKNQELKSLIIQETPWLRDAQSETEQKKRIALLFDLNKMKNEQTKAINQLKEIQMSNGGFPWFKGGNYPNAYITQHIASGFGHLKKLGISKFDKDTQQLILKAVQFLDDEIVEKYQKLIERAERIKAKDGQQKYEDYLAQKHISYFELQYLYMRSFYDKISMATKTRKAVEYYSKQSAKYWNDFNLYGKGLIALAQYRNGNKSVSTKILKSLRENSITSEELGMYWKANTAGYYNYQAPIETQALLIEAFSEIENDTKTIDNLKIWLLKNKQVSQWKTTKATTEAVYALLLQGSDWISVTDLVEVTLGNTKVNPTKMPEVKVEAGTGYFKTSWNGNEITPKMSKVTIQSKGKTIAWGGLYWQYFEDLDKITPAKTPLQLNKKLFKKVNSNSGKKLLPINNKSILQVGDLLTVRIELRVDRAMEFIHMKDMRASGVEPINVLSKYKWQDGLGYYESTKDASTNFFFDRLPKGVYVFEYDVRVNNAGNFSNGITTIESMYAPEFKSHSKGVRIQVNN